MSFYGLWDLKRGEQQDDKIRIVDQGVEIVVKSDAETKGQVSQQLHHQ